MITSIAFESPVEVGSNVTLVDLDNSPVFVPDVCHHWPNGVPSPDHISECDADFILIGDTTGKTEAELGRPLVGASEAKLRDNWRPHGITRAQAYITNVLPFNPALKSNEANRVPTGELVACTQRLRGQLGRALPRVVVPTGNIALKALLGDEKSIVDWRGSVIEYDRGDGHILKVIPTFHPTATFSRPILNLFCETDWAKIAAVIKDPTVCASPAREHIIEPGEDDYERFIKGLSDGYSGSSGIPALSIDIENLYSPKDSRRDITCVGFSYRPDLSITIPTFRRDLGGNLRLIERNWGWVRQLCEWPIDKILVNGLHDAYLLKRQVDIDIAQYTWDLIEMEHCLNPNDGGGGEGGGEGIDDGMKLELRSLAVLTSLYTWQPYYKYLSSDPNPRMRAIYNGLDVCVTREIFDCLYIKLREKGMV